MLTGSAYDNCSKQYGDNSAANAVAFEELVKSL